MLDISPILLVSSAIIFLIVLKQLNSMLYQPLFKHMEDRTESIQKDLELAKSNVADVESMYNEANDIIAKAKQEASSIREQAFADAKAQGDSKITALRTDLDSKYDQFTTDLKNETDALKSALLDNMPEFKEKVTAKISSI